MVIPSLLVKVLRREGIDECRSQSCRPEGWWRRPGHFHTVFAYDMQRGSKVQVKLGGFGKEDIAGGGRGG